MQCAIGDPADYRERQWSALMDSVRKDVECTFGILKVRFRVLKVPSMWKYRRTFDNVFFTCCWLHNMLHTSRAEGSKYDFLWEPGDGSFSIEQAEQITTSLRCAALRFHMSKGLKLKRDFDCSGFGSQGLQQPPSDASELYLFVLLRNQLVNHYAVAMREGRVLRAN